MDVILIFLHFLHILDQLKMYLYYYIYIRPDNELSLLLDPKYYIYNILPPISKLDLLSENEPEPLKLNELLTLLFTGVTTDD